MQKLISLFLHSPSLKNWCNSFSAAQRSQRNTERSARLNKKRESALSADFINAVIKSPYVLKILNDAVDKLQEDPATRKQPTRPDAVAQIKERPAFKWAK